MTDETKSRVLDCCLPGGPCHDAGLADVQHRYLPSDETKRIVEWLRKKVGPEACRLMLAAGMPGGTRTQRTKMAAFAEGCSHATKSIVEALERGDHLKDKTK